MTKVTSNVISVSTLLTDILQHHEFTINGAGYYEKAGFTPIYQPIAVCREGDKLALDLRQAPLRSLVPIAFCQNTNAAPDHWVLAEVTEVNGVRQLKIHDERIPEFSYDVYLQGQNLGINTIVVDKPPQTALIPSRKDKNKAVTKTYIINASGNVGVTVQRNNIWSAQSQPDQTYDPSDTAALGIIQTIAEKCDVNRAVFDWSHLSLIADKLSETDKRLKFDQHLIAGGKEAEDRLAMLEAAQEWFIQLSPFLKWTKHFPEPLKQNANNIFAYYFLDRLPSVLESGGNFNEYVLQVIQHYFPDLFQARKVFNQQEWFEQKDGAPSGLLTAAMAVMCYAKEHLNDKNIYSKKCAAAFLAVMKSLVATNQANYYSNDENLTLAEQYITNRFDVFLPNAPGLMDKIRKTLFTLNKAYTLMGIKKDARNIRIQQHYATLISLYLDLKAEELQVELYKLNIDIYLLRNTKADHPLIVPDPIGDDNRNVVDQFLGLPIQCVSTTDSSSPITEAENRLKQRAWADHRIQDWKWSIYPSQPERGLGWWYRLKTKVLKRFSALLVTSSDHALEILKMASAAKIGAFVRKHPIVLENPQKILDALLAMSITQREALQLAICDVAKFKAPWTENNLSLLTELFLLNDQLQPADQGLKTWVKQVLPMVIDPNKTAEVISNFLSLDQAKITTELANSLLDYLAEATVDFSSAAGCLIKFIQKADSENIENFILQQAKRTLKTPKKHFWRTSIAAQATSSSDFESLKIVLQDTRLVAQQSIINQAYVKWNDQNPNNHISVQNQTSHLDSLAPSAVVAADAVVVRRSLTRHPESVLTKSYAAMQQAEQPMIQYFDQQFGRDENYPLAQQQLALLTKQARQVLKLPGVDQYQFFSKLTSNQARAIFASIILSLPQCSNQLSDDRIFNLFCAMADVNELQSLLLNEKIIALLKQKGGFAAVFSAMKYDKSKQAFAQAILETQHIVCYLQPEAQSFLPALIKYAKFDNIANLLTRKEFCNALTKDYQNILKLLLTEQIFDEKVLEKCRSFLLKDTQKFVQFVQDLVVPNGLSSMAMTDVNLAIFAEALFALPAHSFRSVLVAEDLLTLFKSLATEKDESVRNRTIESAIQNNQLLYDRLIALPKQELSGLFKDQPSSQQVLFSAIKIHEMGQNDLTSVQYEEKFLSLDNAKAIIQALSLQKIKELRDLPEKICGLLDRMTDQQQQTQLADFVLNTFQKDQLSTPVKIKLLENASPIIINYAETSSSTPCAAKVFLSKIQDSDFDFELIYNRLLDAKPFPVGIRQTLITTLARGGAAFYNAFVNSKKPSGSAQGYVSQFWAMVWALSKLDDPALEQNKKDEILKDLELKMQHNIKVISKITTKKNRDSVLDSIADTEPQLVLVTRQETSVWQKAAYFIYGAQELWVVVKQADGKVIKAQLDFEGVNFKPFKNLPANSQVWPIYKLHPTQQGLYHVLVDAFYKHFPSDLTNKVDKLILKNCKLVIPRNLYNPYIKLINKMSASPVAALPGPAAARSSSDSVAGEVTCQINEQEGKIVITKGSTAKELSMTDFTRMFNAAAKKRYSGSQEYPPDVLAAALTNSAQLSTKQQFSDLTEEVYAMNMSSITLTEV